MSKSRIGGLKNCQSVSPRFKTASAPDIVTKSELAPGPKKWAKPAPALQLTGNGMTSLNIQRFLDLKKEQRQQHVKKRLHMAKTTLRKGVQRTQTAGKAKSAFGKAR